MNTEQSIAQGMARLGINIQAAAPLADYVALLERWNRVYNLTAVRKAEDIVIRHILDSLSIFPWIQGPRILDVGSGAGLPGIPLALTYPEWTFYLLDSNGKRTRFLQQAVSELELSNVEVVRARVESYHIDRNFNSIVSRAFATLHDMLKCSGHLCADDGRILAMKGNHLENELANLPENFRLVGIYPVKVPGLIAERYLAHLAPVFSDKFSIQDRVETPKNFSWSDT